MTTWFFFFFPQMGVSSAEVTYARSCTVTACGRHTVTAFSKQSKPGMSPQSVPDTECCQ
jgi:hypothetical protein